MKITAKQYASGLLSALELATKDEQIAIADRFATELKANNALALWPQIEREFKRLEFEAKGEILAEIYSARTLATSEKKIITERLEKDRGSKIIFVENIDSGLIAGAKVKVGDDVYDFSLQDGLKQLEECLLN